MQALSGVCPGCEKKFQGGVYRLDSELTRMRREAEQWQAGRRRRRTSTRAAAVAGGDLDLPVGAVVLLSDGAENSAGGIDLETISAAAQPAAAGAYDRVWRERPTQDVEMEDAVVAHEGDGGVADDGDGELSSAWVRGAEGDAGGAGMAGSCWRRRR